MLTGVMSKDELTQRKDVACKEKVYIEKGRHLNSK
jgi:hypothetical protein